MPASGGLFWSSSSNPALTGIKNSFWFNFGGGWCHLANDDLSQMLTDTAPRIYYAVGHWKLVIEATLFVTGTVVDVWTGTKAAGADPTGDYTRVSGLDLLSMLSVKA